jgi:hypothetical protein
MYALEGNKHITSPSMIPGSLTPSTLFSEKKSWLSLFCSRLSLVLVHPSCLSYSSMTHAYLRLSSSDCESYLASFIFHLYFLLFSFFCVYSNSQRINSFGQDKGFEPKQQVDPWHYGVALACSAASPSPLDTRLGPLLMAFLDLSSTTHDRCNGIPLLIHLVK